MKLPDWKIRLIFGLKLKQLRQEKGLSLSELAQKSSLSISYLNEIENGKKYPKADKIALLAHTLQVTYDSLVSLKLTKHFAPIGDLLESNILEQLPLDHYGIDVNKVLLQISQAPLQLSALVATLIEMARNSELSQNNFSRTAIQTYKELNGNYFPDLEKIVDEFRSKFNLDLEPTLTQETLSKILVDEFHFTIDETTLGKFPEFGSIRGVHISDSKTKKVLLNQKLSTYQKSFIVGKEIAYNYLNIKDRSHIYSDISLNSFDELLNNFKASYFATALMIRKESLIEDLSGFFSSEKWDADAFLSMLDKYNASIEMFFQRITNVLAKYFNIPSFFFLRFNSVIDSDKYSLLKELRLNTNENPGGYQTNEHYCRRWVSIKALKQLEELQLPPEKNDGPIALIQRSTFVNSKNEFLTITTAKKSALLENTNFSISLSILVNEDVRNKINFLDDAEIPRVIVNDTCERCNIQNCAERIAQPVEYERKIRDEELKTALRKLIESGS
ncbi:MAG: helix-turn-helix domain-containing protein [Bacteroidetes bacterium]|nr:helix-turn-helix domain-containing protein [Bacteroidota bacterium]